MRKNDFDFSKPRRQSKIAILLFILKTYKFIVGQLWPVLILLLLKNGFDKPHLFTGVVILVVISTGFAILGYYKHTFYIKGSELVVESGVLRRKKLTIPFDRIQIVNFEQTIIHQVFEVVRVFVDTAGSTKEECKLDALEKDVAEDLRKILLSTQNKNIESEEATDHENRKGTTDEKFIPIMRLAPGDLLVAGLAENHLKSGGVFIVFLFWITEKLREIGLDVGEYTGQIPERDFSLDDLLVFVAVFLIISVFISLFRMVMRNYDLRFWRSENGFKITTGLITTRMTSALDKKIQTISWSDNLLKQMLGIFDLRFKQASSDTVTTSKSIEIVGCRSEHIKFVRQSLYPYFDPDGIKLEKPSIKMLHRLIFFTVLFSAALFVASFFFFEEFRFLAVISLLYFSLKFWLQYHKSFYGLNEDMLMIKGGAFGNRTTLIPLYKNQSVEISQSFYQRRHSLADVILHNASGRLKIPFIELEKAKKIADFVLYTIEKDNKDWM